MLRKLAFNNDRYKRNRGGYSRWLSLSCEKCKTQLLVYQKDGAGILKRLYVDRIISASGALGRRDLVCKKCNTVLGILMFYKKEDRPAYRLFAGAIEKRIIKGNFR